MNQLTEQQLQRTKDDENLNMLRIAHYVVGVMSILFSCLFLFHTLVGFFFIKDSVGLMMGFVGLTMMLAGWLYGGLVVYAGKCIAQRKHNTFIQIMAAVNCCNMPLGFILGIFTFVVINRRSVKEIFELQSLPSPSVARVALPSADFTNYPDPDEEMWREMEKRAKEDAAVNVSTKIENMRTSFQQNALEKSSIDEALEPEVDK